jgi:hypothetical protein
LSEYFDENYVALVSKSLWEVEGWGRVGALDIHLICKLKRMSFLVGEIVNSKGAAFRVDSDNGCVRVVLDKPGKLLDKIIKVKVPEGADFEALYKFEPYIELVMGLCKKYSISYLLSRLHAGMSLNAATLIVKDLNSCVDGIRQGVETKSFLSKLNSYHRPRNKNYKELMDYIDGLFDRYSRLLVVRVDFSYSKENSMVAQSQASRDRKRLFRNARANKLFNHMVGYIWKLEHGPVKGFHYHMIFFFDGAKVREDITKASLVGQYWKDVITEGRGLYYNCNAAKIKYKSCGIGMVDHADSNMRDGLRRAVVYLAKTDLFMRVQIEGRGLGKGTRPAPKSSRGRPRSEHTV